MPKKFVSCKVWRRRYKKNRETMKAKRREAYHKNPETRENTLFLARLRHYVLQVFKILKFDDRGGILLTIQDLAQHIGRSYSETLVVLKHTPRPTYWVGTRPRYTEVQAELILMGLILMDTYAEFSQLVSKFWEDEILDKEAVINYAAKISVRKEGKKG